MQVSAAEINNFFITVTSDIKVMRLFSLRRAQWRMRCATANSDKML